jgi:hypothetical protein
MRHLGDLESPMTVICKHANEAEIDLEKLPMEELSQLASILEHAKTGSGQTTTPAPESTTGNGC